jgi:mannosyltransferase
VATDERRRWAARETWAAPETWAVAAITLAALILRITQLHQSLYGDEVLAYHEIAGRSLGGVINAVKGGVESSPPLFFVLAWLSAKLGNPTIWIRLPSLLLGVATIPVTYQLGRATIGRLAGLIAAAVLAASPFANYYGIEARPYATVAFLAALSTLALVRAVDSGDWRWWATYAVAAAAAAYTHYTVIFILLVQGAWSLWACRDRLREPLLATAGAIVLYLPWLPDVHGSHLGIYQLLEALTFRNVLIDVLRPIFGYPYASLRAIPTRGGIAVLALCAALGAVTLAWRARSRIPSAQSLIRAALSKQALPVWIALATPVGLLAFSILGTDVWDARDLFASAPAAAVVLGGVLASPPRPVLVAVATAGTLVTLAAGTARSISPQYARPPFRTVAEYLDRVATPRDPVIIYPSFLGLDADVAAQLRRPHYVIERIPSPFPRIPAGGAAYLVVEGAFARVLHQPVSPGGYRLVSVRSYPGLVPFQLRTYEAADAAR